MVLAEIDVLDPEAEAFHQSQPGAVQQAGHEMLVAVELGQDGADLGAGEDDREPFRPLGPARRRCDRERAIQDDLVEEQQGTHRLILGRGRDVPFDRQMSEEGFDLAFAHLERMPLARKRMNRLTHWT